MTFKALINLKSGLEYRNTTPVGDQARHTACDMVEIYQSSRSFCNSSTCGSYSSSWVSLHIPREWRS